MTLDESTYEERLRLVEQLEESVEEMVWKNMRTATHSLRPFRLTMPQALALSIIKQFGPNLEMTQLSDISGLPASSITGMMDRLVHRELVERHSDPADRRRMMASITEDGVALLADIRSLNRKTNASVAREFSASEIRTFQALFTRMMEARERAIHNVDTIDESR